MDGGKPPPLDISKLTDGQKMYRYLQFLYGRYADLPSVGDLWIELRCITTGSFKKQADTWYFPPTKQGFIDACWYIRQNRESYDIYNKLVPALIADTGISYPVTGMLWADLDGKGLEDRFRQSERLLVSAHTRHGLQLPHLCTKGRNGVHAYWATTLELLEEPESVQRFERLLKRLSIQISGPPDGEGQFGSPRWDGVSADLNLGRIDATLRPVGSWNHKDPDNPVEVQLLYLANSDELEQAQWHIDLPPLVDPFSMQSMQRLGHKKEGELGPTDRKRVPRRTVEFLMAGYDQPSIHEGLVHAISDFNWANYTADEAQQALLDYVGSTSTRRSKIIDAIKWARKKYDGWNETANGLTVHISGDGRIEHR